MSKFYSSKILLVLIAISVCSTDILAQENPIQTDRPDQTETPALTPRKYYQLEAGFLHEMANAYEKSYQYPSLLHKYGVNDNFELRLITEYNNERFDNNSSYGIAPIIVGFKAKLAEEKGSFPATSFIGHLSLPILSGKNFKTNYYSPSFRFTMQHTFSEKVNLSYNLGSQWDGESAEPTFIYTLSTAIALTE